MRKLAPLALLALTGCQGRQVMLGADSRDAALFANLFQVFLWVTLFFYLIVIGGLVWAILRKRGGGEPATRTALIVWIGVIGATLAALSLTSWFFDRNMNNAASTGLTVEITGHQWWWDVRYDNAESSKVMRTANELHLPAGVPVKLVLRSADVIHSFWAPNLSGKRDLIPGRTNVMVITPEKPGLYRMQCAEFCGLQHAHMAMDVIVEPRREFESWWGRSLLPARAPVTALEKAGYVYVTTRECSTCHNVTGTPATGQVAPDLTHVASRLSLGAGTFPMNRGHLYAWLADPQQAKPGNKMPLIGLEPGQLQAVAAYLESLK